MMGVISECWLAFSVMVRTVLFLGAGLVGIDRKSTRLNSSHP